MAIFPSPEMKANLSKMHFRNPEGTLSEIPHTQGSNLSAETEEERGRLFQSGGAGLFAKPREYVKILAALLNDGTSPTTGAKILSPKTVNTMFENQIPNQPDFARGA